MHQLLSGALFARKYRIVAPLGRGGMGVVYRAEHVGLRKEVALKVVAAADAARFAREATTAARLDHPGCVRVLDHGHTATQCYLAMDLVEGPTLAATMRRAGRMPVQRAIAIARDLLVALAHAHARGVLHRDVKPENAMLAPRGHLVLIDFGLAKLRDDAALTAAGTCIGSPSYLAPERLLGRRYDARADLYGVGVILYEALAGARPFAGGCAEELARAHLDRPARPLRAVRPDVPPWLDRLVLRALARDPEHRHADAAAMLGELVDVPYVEVTAEPTDRDEETTTLALVAQAPSLFARLVGWLRQAPAGR